YLALCLVAGGVARADEQSAKGRIVSVGLFKNGLAIVRLEVAVPGPGTYRLDEVPDPVHGTLWVQSDVAVEAQVQNRDVEVPANEALPGNLQVELAGRKVVVYFRGDKLPPVNGTVVEFKKKRVEPWSRPSPASRGEPDAFPVQPGRYLTLQTP